ncbi:MAG: DUF1501 domain-containing protein [Chthoniobacter sp.]
MKAFNLAEEPDSVRAAFGDEFGQRCLLARRLIQRGVRFMEVGFNLNFVNGAGWDSHNAAQRELHVLIRSLDHVVATLITDLEANKLLDKTLIVIASEFGRPAHFDAGGGRGHHGKSFTVVLAGGGLRTGQCVGTTDDLAMTVAADPVSVPDLFATILAAMGVNPTRASWTANARSRSRIKAPRSRKSSCRRGFTAKAKWLEAPASISRLIRSWSFEPLSQRATLTPPGASPSAPLAA